MRHGDAVTDLAACAAGRRPTGSCDATIGVWDLVRRGGSFGGSSGSPATAGARRHAPQPSSFARCGQSGAALGPRDRESSTRWKGIPAEPGPSPSRRWPPCSHRRAGQDGACLGIAARPFARRGATRRRVAEFLGPPHEWFETALVSPNGRRILTASRNGTTRLWNRATGATTASSATTEGGSRLSPSRPTTPPRPLRWRRLGGQALGPRLGKTIRALKGHREWVLSVAFSPDGHLGDLQASRFCDLWVRAYPRASMPHGLLAGGIYPSIGKREASVEEAKSLSV